jgi:hypothetical protein
VSVSVLRVADQAAGRFPDRCVLSGVDTQRAVRQRAPQWGWPRWLLGVPGVLVALRLAPWRAHETVALPVSDRVWRMWRSRDLMSTTVVTGGATFAVVGLATASTQLLVFGIVVVVSGMAYRTRAHRNYWITCRYVPATETIVVAPTHPRFDEQARALFGRPFDLGKRPVTG